jgi:hypothetical protein
MGKASDFLRHKYKLPTRKPIKKHPSDFLCHGAERATAVTACRLVSRNSLSRSVNECSGDVTFGSVHGHELGTWRVVGPKK